MRIKAAKRAKQSILVELPSQQALIFYPSLFSLLIWLLMAVHGHERSRILYEE